MLESLLLIVLVVSFASTIDAYICYFDKFKLAAHTTNDIKRWTKSWARNSKGDKKESVEESARIESLFDSWYSKCKEKIMNVENLEEVSLPADYEKAHGSIRRSAVSNSVPSDDTEEVVTDDDQFQFHCKAFTGTEKIAYFREVSFHGQGFHVLNLLVLPNLSDGVNLPVLGVDIVSLPGGTLANIDFQPLRRDTSYLSQPLYMENATKLKKWSISLPSGGDLPESARPFFSPLCLWTRFPNARRTACLYLVGQALDQYTDIYCQELLRKQPVQSTSLQSVDNTASIQGMHTYLQYRIDEDPAKNLLVRVFGKQWTEEVLEKVLFPRHLFPSMDKFTT